MRIRVNIKTKWKYTVGFGVAVTQMTETVRGEKCAAELLAQIPLGRWSETEEGSNAVWFLLSDAASYITGDHISVNGGHTIGL